MVTWNYSSTFNLTDVHTHIPSNLTEFASFTNISTIHRIKYQSSRESYTTGVAGPYIVATSSARSLTISTFVALIVAVADFSSPSKPSFTSL